MCLIVFAWKAHPRYPLILATNRDEYHERPSAPLSYWDDAPEVLGGRDIEKGGSWLAANVDGRWAAVTNFRDGHPSAAPTLSRGDLVRNYVSSRQMAANYATTLEGSIPNYPGCNLLFAEPDALYYASNRHGSSNRRSRIETVSTGVHSLSNHLLDTPWPKVERSKHRMQSLLEANGDTITQNLFDFLSDRTEAVDADLPSTGIPADWERTLSAPFIVAGKYGTRASTVVLMDNEGVVQMHEREFSVGGIEIGRRSFSFKTAEEPA